MSRRPPDIEEGWGWPADSRKCHYFVQSRSLCGKWLKWLFAGTLRPYDGEDSIDDCRACAKQLARLKAGKETPPCAP